MESELTTKDGMKTITIFYTGQVESWDALFREAAARYGLVVNENVRFVAMPAWREQCNSVKT